MKLEVLGAYGSRGYNKHSTCFKLSSSLYIDAGNLLNSNNINKVEYIFLTHSHLDHITDIPFLIDNIYEKRKTPLKIYASKETLNDLKQYIFNTTIWPDFHNINLLDNDKKTIEFIEIKENQEIIIDNISLIPILVNHTIKTYGYIINKKILITADTYLCENIKKAIKDFKIKNVICEVSFPNRLEKLAKVSKHLTPSLIKNFFKDLDVTLYFYHLKPPFINEIENDLEKENFSQNYFILDDETTINFEKNKIIKKRNLTYEYINITKNILYEQNQNKLLKRIVNYARLMTNADAATLYIKSEDDKYLDFKIVENETLNMFLDKNINWPKLPLYINGKKNTEMVAVLSALEGKLINIKDAYNEKNFNFEGTKKFDKNTGYRSKSMLVIPLKNHENEVIGVLQLINKIENGKIIEFNKEDEKIIETLASIAAITLTKNQLIKDFENLFESLIKTIGMAIDEKSKYTGGHVRRVAKIALMIASSLNDLNIKKYSQKDFKLLEIAGWMHDIGKLTTPEYIMDKSTKLEKVIDRIEYIKYKFDILILQTYIKYLKNEISKQEYENLIKQYNADFEFLKNLNKGSEFVSDEKLEKLRKIKEYKMNNENLLNEDEFYNLSIKKGTLNDEELKIMRNHAKIGLEMLKKLHFPKKYKNIVHIAANHHEKLNCQGYPQGLCKEDLTLEDRIMAIADIFEALSSKDRPYKEPKKLSEIFKILYFMAKDGEIDKDIIKIVIQEKIYLKYAKEELLPEQIDEIPKEILDYFLN